MGEELAGPAAQPEGAPQAAPAAVSAPEASPASPRPSTDEAESERAAQLDRALSRGALKELPPNQVRGLLGERNPKLKVVDDLSKPDLNAGVSQEMDLPVVWMAIVLAYLLFFPLAYVILWRTRYISHRDKAIVSVVGAAGIVAVVVWLVVN
jgi:hypothetical protein